MPVQPLCLQAEPPQHWRCVYSQPGAQNKSSNYDSGFKIMLYCFMFQLDVDFFQWSLLTGWNTFIVVVVSISISIDSEQLPPRKCMRRKLNNPTGDKFSLAFFLYVLKSTSCTDESKKNGKEARLICWTSASA